MKPAKQRSDIRYTSYEDFGRRFFEHAVTVERVSSSFDQIAGSKFDFGPIGVGPGKLAKVSAKVELGEPRLEREEKECITFELVVPLTIDLTIDLQLDKHRFDVSGEIYLHLTARAAEPLKLIIDVDEPSTRDVKIDVSPETFRGALVRIIASVDLEIKRFIAKYVAKEIRKPEIEKAREIDLAARIDAAWEHQHV
ncbi:hypothetical protein FOS14_00950 [Skermania sp. ID1734]|uniref:hypothetical protein n=1 Tax=Skermania sp. ID1734 TaxID=2597516 RepID=UPI0011806AC9|nr:hypothetical protein [Skermania sp. ID1734]TSE01990.1 hypothetical protein FOS14_00950 [Skermania sp. ID1734]